MSVAGAGIIARQVRGVYRLLNSGRHISRRQVSRGDGRVILASSATSFPPLAADGNVKDHQIDIS